MAKKSILKLIVYDDFTFEVSRGADCDDKTSKGAVKKKRKKKKKP